MKYNHKFKAEMYSYITFKKLTILPDKTSTDTIINFNYNKDILIIL